MWIHVWRLSRGGNTWLGVVWPIWRLFVYCVIVGIINVESQLSSDSLACCNNRMFDLWNTCVEFWHVWLTAISIVDAWYIVIWRDCVGRVLASINHEVRLFKFELIPGSFCNLSLVLLSRSQFSTRHLVLKFITPIGDVRLSITVIGLLSERNLALINCFRCL